jgi:hypothetical protein
MEPRHDLSEQETPPGPARTAPRPARPLAALADDAERLGAILRAGEAVFGDLPALRNALVAWLVLLAARKSLPPDPRSLAYGLWSQGWKLVEPTERPRSGDVFLLAGPDRRPTHVGIVVKVSTDGTWFTAVDDTLAPGQGPYRRLVQGGGMQSPVASFLRFG